MPSKRIATCEDETQRITVKVAVTGFFDSNGLAKHGRLEWRIDFKTIYQQETDGPLLNAP
jgi:hypothetical protein